MAYDVPHSVFLNGMLHLATMNKTIVAVDTTGSTWKTIRLREDMLSTYWSQWHVAFIGKSQGRLHYVDCHENGYTLSVWMLEGDDRWIRKHTVSTRRLFRTNKFLNIDEISVVAIHPEHNTIFFTLSDDKKLISYDMDRRETRVRGVLNHHNDGQEGFPYLPYVPSWRLIPS
jgi:hypothetical protein